VPDFELAVDVVDRASLGIVLVPDTGVPSAGAVIAIAVRAGSDGRALCQVPDAGWTVDASPLAVCQVRSSTFVVGSGPAIAIGALAAGTCTITVADASATVTDTIQLVVR